MPPISLLEPLLLREFFFVIANTNSGLDKMESNPFSIQYPWEENPEWLQRWKQVPIILTFHVLKFFFV